MRPSKLELGSILLFHPAEVFSKGFTEDCGLGSFLGKSGVLKSFENVGGKIEVLGFNEV